MSSNISQIADEAQQLITSPKLSVVRKLIPLILPASSQRTEKSYLFASLLLALIVTLLASKWFRTRHDPREPPLVPMKFPIIGHVLGLLRHGVPYYAIATRDLADAPVYTFDLFFTKMYIMKSANLVAAVQKNHKTISFDPFLTNAANRMAGINGRGLKLLQEEKSGGEGLNYKVIHAMHPALIGEGLDAMNKTMITGLLEAINILGSSESRTVDLHAWCRNTITEASTKAVWGPDNPYNDETIRDAFWQFEPNLSMLMLNLWPQWTARTPFRAREKIVKQFVKYYERGAHFNSSALTLARWKAQHDGGAVVEDIARLETASSVGVLSNTVPSTFWTLYEIYKHTDLLETLRLEIKNNALTIDPATNDHIVDLGLIREGCPQLVSTFQEVLRLHSNGAPTRVVYDDIVVDNRWLLKAGAVVQMLAPSVNQETATWGADAKSFESNRFRSLGNDQEAKAYGSTPRATSYMSFGVSPNMCAGRHFAAGEILGLAAMVILRYNIVPVDGQWWSPRLNAWAIAASVTPPVEAYPVEIQTRHEFEGVARWAFNVTEGKGRFSLIVG